MSQERAAHILAFREYIEQLYRTHPTGCGGSFGEILCFEIHDGDQESLLDYDESRAKNGAHAGCDFKNLAKKWGIPVAFLGQLVSHHCALLEDSDNAY
jgi:hypothetical protein